MARDITSSVLVAGSDVAILDITGPMTIHAWVNLDSASSGVILAKYTTGAGGGQYLFRANSSRVGMWMLDAADAGHEAFSPSGSLRTGVWQAATGRSWGPIGSNAMHAWCDGISGAPSSLPSSNPNNAQLVRIGRDGAGTQQLDGRVAHATVWNAALTDNEVLMLAQGYHPLTIRPGNLAGYWPLDGYGASGTAKEEIRNTLLTPTGTVTTVPGPWLPHRAPQIHLQNLTPPGFTGAPIAAIPGTVLSG